MSEDSESDNFSVEFEVESIDSETYSENDEESIPGEDEVSALFHDRVIQTLVLARKNSPVSDL